MVRARRKCSIGTINTVPSNTNAQYSALVVDGLRHLTHGMVYPCVEILLSRAVLACNEALDVIQAHADIIDINRAFGSRGVT